MSIANCLCSGATTLARLASMLSVAAALTLPAAPAAAQQKVTIGVSSRSFNPGFSNMWIGIPLGLYGPSIQAEAHGTQGASENLQLMLTGGVTMSTGTQDVLLAAQAEGRTLPVVIPCVYLRGMIHRISVKPDSPIKAMADLKGKTIGVPTLAAGQVPYLRYVAKSVAIDPDSLQMVAVGYGQQAAVSLTSGKVDALAHIDVDVARLQALNIATRELDQPDNVKNSAVAYVWAFTKPWFEANKAVAADLLQGMIKAVILMLENPEAAVRISYHMHPEGIPTGVPFEKAVSDAVLNIKARAPAIERETAGSKRWCEFSDASWKEYVAMLGLEGKADASKFYTSELIDRINAFDEPKLRAWARGLKVPVEAAEFQRWASEQKPPR